MLALDQVVRRSWTAAGAFAGAGALVKLFPALARSYVEARRSEIRYGPVAELVAQASSDGTILVAETRMANPSPTAASSLPSTSCRDSIALILSKRYERCPATPSAFRRF